MTHDDTLATPPLITPDTSASSTRHSLLNDYMTLGKVRLSGMVVLTTALGFVAASKASAIPQDLNWAKLAWTCLGTFLAAIGASAFNQAIEARRDGKMNRTRNRPIPAGRISKAHAAYFGLLASIIGVAILCPTSNGLTAILATANIMIYVLVYTPMKPVSAGNTLVGAVVGAIPPMMGWSAASGALSIGAWILGGILFVWQIPHFLALAWMYKDDYAKGGYKMISTIEPSGRLTGMLSVLYAFALIPLCLAITYFGYAGWMFAIVGVALSLCLLMMAGRFAITRERGDARRLFLASILYLPLLATVLILDARGPNTMVHNDYGLVSPGADAPIVDPGQ